MKTASLTASLVCLLMAGVVEMTLGTPALDAQSALRPLPVEALVNLNTFSGRGLGTLSPDGRWFVYTVREGARLRGKAGSESRYLPTVGARDSTDAEAR